MGEEVNEFRDMEITETPKRRRGTRERALSTFISKRDMADALGIGNMITLDRWIIKGSFPPPHARLGDRYTVWLREHWDYFVKHREWPKAAWAKAR